MTLDQTPMPSTHPAPLRSARRSLLLAATVTAVLLLAPSVAGAATITVETTDDVSATECTLRDAIGSANDDALDRRLCGGRPEPDRR
jgi:hypothetical protein